MRRALGARKRDILLQLLCDSFLLASSGGLLGLALSAAGLRFVRKLPFRYLELAHIDMFMVSLAVFMVLVCSVVTGFVPAWVASRRDPSLVIKSAA